MFGYHRLRLPINGERLVWSEVDEVEEMIFEEDKIIHNQQSSKPETATKNFDIESVLKNINLIFVKFIVVGF
jgi:hypothetical protein